MKDPVNSSLIVSVIYNNNSFLFMGDSENARIKDFISSNTKTYNFIKIPAINEDINGHQSNLLFNSLNLL